MLETSVQGVVVQTSSDASPASGPDVRGKRTKTEGSTTVSYPWASSWSDRPVPQRGHQGATRWSWTSRSLAKISFSDHHTESTYSGSIVRYASSRSTQ
ncbi:hypothetical protein SCALM49S_00271 [Streptomyces californicus]